MTPDDLARYRAMATEARGCCVHDGAAAILALCDEVERLNAEQLDALEVLVRHECSGYEHDGPALHSGAISDCADALRELAAAGRVEILSDDGHRMVGARWRRQK